MHPFVIVLLLISATEEPCDWSVCSCVALAAVDLFLGMSRGWICEFLKLCLCVDNGGRCGGWIFL